MRTEAGAAWGHGRHLTGRARLLTVVTDGQRRPVTGPLLLTTAGLAGDEHAGGPDQAVTVHPWEHYGAWIDAGAHIDDEPAFGEQLTSIGLSETEVFVGDTFRWGGADVMVTGPAVPAAELAARLGVPGLTEAMLRNGRTGFHLRVVRSGRVGPADTLELIDVDPAGLALAVVGRALIDGPAAAGVTPQRLLLVRDLLPPALVATCEGLLPPTDDRAPADRMTAVG